MNESDDMQIVPTTSVFRSYQGAGDPFSSPFSRSLSKAISFSSPSRPYFQTFQVLEKRGELKSFFSIFPSREMTEKCAMNKSILWLKIHDLLLRMIAFFRFNFLALIKSVFSRID